MKGINKNNLGFTITEVLLVILTLAIIGVAGYFVARHIDKTHNTQTSTSSSQVALIITRSNPLKQPGISDFTIEVRNQQTANTILSDLKKLQPPLLGVVNCPEDNGVEYTLAFTSPPVTYDVEASGCEDITLNNKTVYTADTTNSSGTVFWDALSKATGKNL